MRFGNMPTAPEMTSRAIVAADARNAAKSRPWRTNR